MPISSVYLSSTYEDLKSYRQVVGAYLRKLNKQVIGMEDYVAADERPLDKCLHDVEQADLYVGLFAYRYGHIPSANNPEARSITELEFRHARASGKPTLIFLHDPNGPWPLVLTDHHSGESGKGARIDALRAELGADTTISWFQNEIELAALVNTAVTKLESTKADAVSDGQSTANTLDYRQITSELFITHGAADDALVKSLADDLVPNPNGLSSFLAASDIFASTESAFLNLDAHLETCDVAAVILSPTTLAQMAQASRFAAMAIETMRARTGVVIGLCTAPSCVETARRWDFTTLIDISAYLGGRIETLQALKVTLGSYRTTSSLPLIGVPLVVAAMTQEEAKTLSESPEMIGDDIGMKAQKRFEAIRDALPQPLSSRYGPTREGWLSPGSTNTIAQISKEALEKLLRVKNPRLRGRAVKVQRYPFEPLLHNVQELREVYRRMADRGCIMIVDELSLFHPAIRRALATCPMSSARNTAVLTVSPFGVALPEKQEILREELKGQLASVTDRFELDFDPQCELGVGDEWRLRRWLHQSFPAMLQTLREPPVEPAQVALFAKEIKADERPAPSGPPSIL